MRFAIELHPLAEQEITDSYNWYEERSIGLGARFINSINKRFKQLQETPDRYAIKYKNFREANIDVFPYTIIYELIEEKQIVFVSYVFHTKRNPKRKYRR